MENNDLPLNVNFDEESNTLTIDWDENDPKTRLFNTWSEADFHRAIVKGLQEHILDKQDTEFTVDQFVERFDELFERVENGETLTIIHSDGTRVLMLPIDGYNACTTGSTTTNE